MRVCGAVQRVGELESARGAAACGVSACLVAAGSLGGLATPVTRPSHPICRRPPPPPSRDCPAPPARARAPPKGRHSGCRQQARRRGKRVLRCRRRRASRGGSATTPRPPPGNSSLHSARRSLPPVPVRVRRECSLECTGRGEWWCWRLQRVGASAAPCCSR